LDESDPWSQKPKIDSTKNRQPKGRFTYVDPPCS
jgi:hypothetical protein